MEVGENSESLLMGNVGNNLTYLYHTNFPDKVQVYRKNYRRLIGHTEIWKYVIYKFSFTNYTSLW